MTELSDLTTRRPQAITSARQAAAWVDRSTFGRVTVKGADRLDLLHRLTTNDLTGMKSGDGRQTVLLTEKARIIDVITVLEDASSATLITSPSATTSVVSWLKKYIIMDDVRVADTSANMSMLEIMGPRSNDVVAQLTGLEVAGLPKTHWASTADADPITIVRMPSSCEVSYWIMASTERMSDVVNALKEQGDNLPELTNDEDEYLRICSGMGRLGHEWSDAYNPLEAGLLHLTSFTKGCYIGQEVVARLDSYNKVKQRVMALVGTDPVEAGNSVLAEGTAVGTVTSAVRSLDNTRTIALAYVRGEHAHEGTTVTVNTAQGVCTVTLQLPPVEE